MSWITWGAVAISLALTVPLLAEVVGGEAASVVFILAIAGAAFVTLIFLWPNWGLYLLVFSFYSLHWLTDSLQVLPRLFNFVPDVLVITVLLRSLFERLRRGGTLPRTPADVPVLLFVGVAVLSAALNRNDSLIVYLNGLFRQNLKFILLFYALVYLKPTERVMRRLILLFIGLQLLQIPVTIVQFFIYKGWQPISEPGKFVWDFAGGTMGASSTGVLSIASLMVMALLFGMSEASRRLRYIVLGLALFVPAVVGEGKIVFVLGPLLVVFLLFRHRLRLNLRSVILLVGFAIAYIVSIAAIDALLPEANSLQNLFSPARLFSGYERSLSTEDQYPRSRVMDIQFAARWLEADPLKMLFGYGPGTTSYAFVEAANGSLYRQLEPFWDQPFFYFGITQVSTTALEYGYVGLTMYGLLLIRIYRHIGRCTWQRAASPGDWYWRGIAWGFRGVILVFAVGVVYWRVWSTEILGSMFWMLAGILFIRSRYLKHAYDHTSQTSETL